MALTIGHLKAFVGTIDFETSRDFYSAIGWKMNFETEQLAEFEFDGFRFFLQRYYVADWCNNSMFHAEVESAQDWYEKVTAVLEQRKYGAARVRPPKEQSYGALVTFMWDPAGVLWHLAQPLPSSD